MQQILDFFNQSPKYKMIVLALISLIACQAVFFPILNLAKKKNLTDDPDARKLQKQPVPVLGGAAVFFGMMIGMCFFKTMHTYTSLFPIVSAMVIMLYIGMLDDIMGTRAWVRFVLEIMVALLIVYGNRFYICNFQGLWGIDTIPFGLGVLLSVITFVGVVNAINMIDGVDGLCSGFCVMACIFFGVLFFLAHDYSYAALAAISAGALVPFIIHNVFGWESKMFIGDGGTMVMGTMISAMVFELLRGKFHVVLVGFTQDWCALDFSLIAFCLAVLAIPIFDTLRVMTERICRGVSPFSPDKTHLHHRFIALGCSYIFTTLSELFLNLVIIAVFIIAWLCGASVDWQLYWVIITAALIDFGGSALMKHWAVAEKGLGPKLRASAPKTSVSREGFWKKVQRVVDKG